MIPKHLPYNHEMHRVKEKNPYCLEIGSSNFLQQVCNCSLINLPGRAWDFSFTGPSKVGLGRWPARRVSPRMQVRPPVGSDASGFSDDRRGWYISTPMHVDRFLPNLLRDKTVIQSKAVTLLSLAENEPLPGTISHTSAGALGAPNAVHTADQLHLCPQAASTQPYHFCLV